MLTTHDEEPLGFLLVDVTRLLRIRIDRAFEDAGLGITPGEARTLVYVGRLAPLHQRELAVQMSVEPMTLVRYLDRLEERGLIRREVDPADKRAKLVSLSREAKPLLRTILALAQQAREEAMAGLSTTDVARLRSALVRMRSNMSTDRTQVA
jgi:DNA-binding MarR family transcriptional regulator